MFDLPDYEKSVFDLKSLSKAVIDSSSIIYMHKSGFLPVVLDYMSLYAPLQVKSEIGMHIDISWMHVITPIADFAVAGLAEKMSLPVISDDKKIITTFLGSELSAYNSLMILNWLYLKKHITLTEHLDFLNSLLSVARYSPRVIEYGNQILSLILKYDQFVDLSE